MKIYRQKLYSNAKRKGLHRVITRMGDVRNYAVKMMEKYNALHRKPKEGETAVRKCADGKMLTAYDLSNHIARKKKNPNCATAKMLEGLPSQAVQETFARVYKGWNHYIKTCKKRKRQKKEGKAAEGKRVRKPHKIKPWLNKSFTLLQAGYKFVEDNHVILLGKKYGFHKSQPIKGRVKRVTVKRDGCGDLWLVVLTDWYEPIVMPRTGKSAGFDFGLKTYLTGSDGFDIECPLFLKNEMDKYRRLSSQVGKKAIGSNNRRKARRALARMLRRIVNRREDWQWKTVWELIRRYDVICLETLNIEAMKKMWGRKISDLAFSSFVAKLEYLAARTGRIVVFVDRWSATSQTCHVCGEKNPITKDLRVREWECPHCHAKHDRDRNAAINLYREGTSSLGLGSVRPSSERRVA